MTSEASEPLLSGRVILISGAHGGLGEAAARACAAAGASVVLLGRRVPKLERVYDALAAIGPTPAIFPLDLEGASPADYAEMVQRLREEFGRLDGVLHCAAEFRGLSPLELTEALDFARMLHVNVTAPWLLSQACLPLLREASDAALVFVLDDREQVGRAYWGAYGVAEHALAGLVAILSDELENSPVRVSALQPGPMRTALRARAHFGVDPAQWPEPAVYAPALLHLLSAAGVDRRGQIWSLAL